MYYRTEEKLVIKVCGHPNKKNVLIESQNVLTEKERKICSRPNIVILKETKICGLVYVLT